MQLNKSELWVGAFIGGSMVFFIKWWALITVPAAAFLWALGGSESRLYRCIGIAFIAQMITVFHFRGFFSSLLIGVWSYWIAFLAARLGYGIPTTQPPDKGSNIGRFWYQMFQMREVEATLATRATISFVMTLAFLPLAWINLLGYLYGSMILVFGMTLAGTFVHGEVEI